MSIFLYYPMQHSPHPNDGDSTAQLVEPAELIAQALAQLPDTRGWEIKYQRTQSIDHFLHTFLAGRAGRYAPSVHVQTDAHTFYALATTGSIEPLDPYQPISAVDVPSTLPQTPHMSMATDLSVPLTICIVCTAQTLAVYCMNAQMGPLSWVWSYMGNMSTIGVTGTESLLFTKSSGDAQFSVDSRFFESAYPINMLVSGAIPDFAIYDWTGSLSRPYKAYPYMAQGHASSHIYRAPGVMRITPVPTHAHNVRIAKDQHGRRWAGPFCGDLFVLTEDL